MSNILNVQPSAQFVCLKSIIFVPLDEMSTVKCIDNHYFIKIGIVPDGKKKEDTDCNWHQAKFYKNNAV